jgi:hypothetical protein
LRHTITATGFITDGPLVYLKKSRVYAALYGQHNTTKLGVAGNNTFKFAAPCMG